MCRRASNKLRTAGNWSAVVMVTNNVQSAWNLWTRAKLLGHVDLQLTTTERHYQKSLAGQWRFLSWQNVTQLIRLSSRDASRVVRKCAFNHTRLLLYANVDQSPLSRHGHVLSTNRSRTSLNSHFLINVQCYICYFIFGLYVFWWILHFMYRLHGNRIYMAGSPIQHVQCLPYLFNFCYGIPC